MKAMVSNVGVEVSITNTKWKLNVVLFADNNVLLAKSKICMFSL